MANIWCVCNDLVSECRNITTNSAGTCPEIPLYASFVYQYQDYELNASSAYGVNISITVNLTYYYQQYLVVNNEVKSSSGSPTGPFISTQTVTITAGNTIEDYQVPCRYTVDMELDGYGSGFIQYAELDSVSVRAQSSVPTCGDEPEGCLLAITGYTSSAPSVRGADDGSITASVSGMTGSTITWYIDGVEYTGSTAYQATFSDLEAGTYVVRAEEGPCLSQQSVVVADGDFRTGDFTVTSPSGSGNIVAVENPVIIQIATAINSISPKYSINEFDITGSISGVEIEFALTFPYVYSARFYSKGFPDRSNYFLESVLTNEVGTSVGTNTQAEIATSLAEAFENDSVISRLYYIFVDDTTVTLTSKETNPYYDLSTDNVTITGSNLTLTNSQGGVAEFDGQLSEDYSIYTEVFVDDQINYGEAESSLDYKRVAEIELPFNKTNKHQFDISPILKNFVSSPKFNFSFSGSTIMADMIHSYYVKYGEKYPLIANSNTKKKRNKGTGGFNWFINSALDFELPNVMNAYFPPSGTTGEIMFLNTSHNGKYSHRDAKEFLNIVVEDSYQYPLAIYADIEMYDSTTYEDIKLYDIITSGATNTGGVYVCAVSYDCCLSPYETSGGKIRSVDLSVKQYSGSTWVGYSETKTIRFNIDEQEDQFNIAFLNKFGAYETYTFVGEKVEQADIFRETYQRPYDINPDGSASGGFEYNSTLDTDYTKVYTLNTGIIDSETFYYVQGLIQSNRLFHYDDESQTYLTIVNQTVSKSSNENEYFVQIVVKETINENNVEK